MENTKNREAYSIHDSGFGDMAANGRSYQLCVRLLTYSIIA